MFGGDGNAPFAFRNLIYVAVGKHAGKGGAVDNQIAALDPWSRAPIEVVPLGISAEWGFEDNAGEWKDVPGIVVGGEVAAVPGLATLSFGVEWASFAPRCCGNPMGYRHWRHLGVWAVDGIPPGHPLEGHGA